MLTYEVLTKLANRLEKAGGGDEDMDVDVFVVFQDELEIPADGFAPTRGLDDAHMLLQALDPRSKVTMLVQTARGECRVVVSDGDFTGIARRSEDQMALALTEAVVRWRAAVAKGAVGNNDGEADGA